MKSLGALLITLILAFGAQLDAAQASRWEKFRNVGWTAHDQLTRERWQEIQKILRTNIGKNWSSWGKKNERLATLRKELPKHMQQFMDHYIDAYSKLDEAERRKLMNILDDAASGLFGRGSVTQEHKKALADMQKAVDQVGIQLFESGDKDVAGDVGALALAMQDQLDKGSGETKKEIEAKKAVPAKKPA